MTQTGTKLAMLERIFAMYFIIKVKDGAALLSLSNGQGNYCGFRLEGSSVRTSANPGDLVSELYAYPEAGKDGVLFLTGPTGKAHSVGLKWDNEKLIVSRGDGAEQFLNPKRLVQPYDAVGYPVNSKSGSSSYLEVEIDGIRYTTNRQRAVRGARFVADANALCRYWVGDVEEQAVKEAATETAVYASFEDELAALGSDQERLERLHGELKATQAALTAAHRLHEEFEREQAKRQREFSLMRENRNEWVRLARRLAGAFQGRWFVSSKTKALLAEVAESEAVAMQ